MDKSKKSRSNAQPNTPASTSAKSNPLGAAALRREAEAKIRKAKLKPTVLPLSETDVRKLVQELQVHQIELEMQNEELIRSRAEVESALLQYTELYDFAPVGYCTVTPTGNIKRINFAGALLLGTVRGQIIDRRFRLFVAPKHRETFDTLLSSVFQAKRKGSCEVQLADDNQSNPRWVSIEASSSDGGQECYIIVSDISERKRAESMAREATRAREILIQNLQFALDNKESFHGVLPICATCKKIRDKKGIWHQIEAYISAHTKVSFTHGICPECAKNFFDEGA